MKANRKSTGENKPYVALKQLGERARAKDREAAQALLDDKAQRRSKKALQREKDAAAMKKSLVHYPANPRVWEAPQGDVEGAKAMRAKTQQASKAGRKAKAKAARELRQAEKKAAREQRIAERKAKQAEKAALREQRKAERREAQKLKKLQRIEPTDEMLDNAMEVVRSNFKMSDKKAERVRANIMLRFAEKPLRQQRNYLKNFELRVAVLQAYKVELDAVLAKLPDTATKKTSLVEDRKNLAANKEAAKVKATAKNVKAVQKAAKAPQPEEVGTVIENAFEDAPTEQQKRKASNADKAAFGARLAMQNRVRISDTPRPAPKATAGKPVGKKAAVKVAKATKKNGKK